MEVKSLGLGSRISSSCINLISNFTDVFFLQTWYCQNQNDIPGFLVRVFFSYSRQDKLLAKKIVEALTPYHDIWVDWEDIEAGTEWRVSINMGIRRCDVFIFLASHHSVNSEYCEWEIKLAQRRMKKIIPIVIEENLPLSRDIAQRQWIFLDKDNDLSFNLAIRSLLSAMKPRPSPHWVYVALVEAIIIGILVLFK